MSREPPASSPEQTVSPSSYSEKMRWGRGWRASGNDLSKLQKNHGKCLYCWKKHRHILPLDTGRKLNVLCTFNLHPVSRGLKSGVRNIARGNCWFLLNRLFLLPWEAMGKNNELYWKWFMVT